MLRPSESVQVYLYTDPVDMRKSIDGLSALVESEMALSPTITERRIAHRMLGAIEMVSLFSS